MMRFFFQNQLVSYKYTTSHYHMPLCGYFSLSVYGFARYSQELHYEKKKNNDFFAYMPKNHYLCTQIALKGLFNPSQPRK